MRRPKIDWRRLAINISERMPMSHASKQLGLSEGYIKSLIGNHHREPRFMNGLLLLTLHLDLVGIERHRELIKW